MNLTRSQIPDPIPIDPAWIPGGIDEIKDCTLLDHRRLPGDAVGTFRMRFSRWDKKALKKKKPLPVSEFSERHIILPMDSPVPGKFKCHLTPWLTGIMDAIMFESVREAVICAPDQSGKTQLCLNIIGYTTDRRPGNWLIVYPDEKTAAGQMKDRMQTLFQDSPRLRKYMTGYVDDKAALRMNLRHMKIYMAWANSAAQLKTRPLPYTLEDEIDEYPITPGKRVGEVHDLVVKRSRNFRHMSKNIRISTATTTIFGIHKALAEDVNIRFYYFVRCPQCGHFQVMEFKNIKWEGGADVDPKVIKVDPNGAWYECNECKSRWSNAERDAAVRAGEWYDKKTGLRLDAYLKAMRPEIIGFQYPAWIMRNVPLQHSAAAFLRGIRALKIGDINPFRNFKNSHEAIGWEYKQKEREKNTIIELRDDRPAGRVPGGDVVSAMTAGVDTQDDGFWFKIMAWGWGGETLSKDSWVIRTGFILTWGELQQILWENKYTDVDGKEYVVSLVIQDALGHRTSAVYDFCIRHRGKVIPSFGKDIMAQPYAWNNLEYFPRTKKPIPGGLKGVRVNTKYYKDELALLLSIKSGDPSSMRFNSEISDAEADHYTAEFVNKKGLWECPMGKPNHLWDCAVLNLVAADILGVKYWGKPDAKPKEEKTPGPETGTGSTWVRSGGFKKPGWLKRR